MRFKGFNCCVLEGTLIYKLRGVDPDGDKLEFGVKQQSGSNVIRVESTSPTEANVYLNQELDREVSCARTQANKFFRARIYSDKLCANTSERIRSLVFALMQKLAKTNIKFADTR